MNTKCMKKEWFVVRIGSGPSGYPYLWLATDTTDIGVVPDLEDARKYSDLATAERDAQRIVERDGETAVILKYTETVAGIVNPSNSPTNVSFFEWLDTIDDEKEYEKYVYASNLGKRYYDNGKHPDEFLGEIIEIVEREFKEN